MDRYNKISYVSGRGVDENIMAAADTSGAFEFLQDNNTVLTELDILMPRDEWDYMQTYGLVGQETKPMSKRDVDRYKRKGISDRNKRWPNDTVHFEFRGCFSKEDKEMIYSAMREYHRYTCIRFKPASLDMKAKIYFLDNDGGCSAFVGCYYEPQPVNLGKSCRKKGTVIHELAHTVGCHHEQGRPDRDRFIKIHENNMIYGMEGQFKKYNSRIIPDWGIPYDYSSVMHYGDKAFSRNRKRTITAVQSEYQSALGNRRGFTFLDLKMINTMYQCDSKCDNPPKCPDSGFVGRDCKCWCKGPDVDSPIQYCTGGGTPTDLGPAVEHETNTDDECGNKICKDKVSDCHKYKDYCGKSSWKTFMDNNCYKTCGCASNSGGGVRDHVTNDHQLISAGDERCEDQNHKCEMFAMHNECKTNRLYMASMCRKSCNMCGISQPEIPDKCEDTNPICPAAAMTGECNLNKAYMYGACRKSCRLCK